MFKSGFWKRNRAENQARVPLKWSGLYFGTGRRGWTGGPDIHQSIVPKDHALGKKIGITPNDRVLVFAGYAGDWARALSEFCEVHFTDISKSVVKHVESQRANIRSFNARPAEVQPRRKSRLMILASCLSTISLAWCQ